MVQTQTQAELERKNMIWGLALFGIFLLILVGSTIIAFVYLAFD